MTCPAVDEQIAVHVKELQSRAGGEPIPYSGYPIVRETQLQDRGTAPQAMDTS